MISLLRKLASLKLTLVGMVALAVLSLVGTRSEVVDVGWTVAPIVFLSLNLLAAILTNRSFRTQSGLLVFHVGLLLVFVLIGLTVVTRFNGRIEVLQGEAFDPSLLEVVYRGPLHRGDLADIHFVQREFEVDYLPGIVRQATRSTIEFVDDAGALRAQTIGDKKGIEFGDYRVLATANKGFALVLGWEAVGGDMQYGAVHLPSYPRHDWKQLNEWITPAGQPVQLELEFDDPMIVTDEAWTLRYPKGAYRLRVVAGGEMQGLAEAGGYVDLEGGRLHVAELRLWMGYGIDYYPFLPWLFTAAMLTIGGLAAHFGNRYLRLSQRVTNVAEREVPEAHVAHA